MIYVFADCAGAEKISGTTGCMPENLWGIRLRDKGVDSGRYLCALERLCDWKQKRNGAFYITASYRPQCALPSGVDFVHFASDQKKQAAGFCQKPRVFSCHTYEDLAFAKETGIEYVTLSPVFMPLSPKNYSVDALGIEKFSKLAEEFSGLKIFALGGIKKSMLCRMQNAGAFGICGISLVEEIF